jgi:hypothetical protein
MSHFQTDHILESINLHPKKMTRSEEECSDDETPSGSAVTPSSLSLTDVAQDIFGLSTSSILKTGNLRPSEEIDDDKVSAELISHLYRTCWFYQ